MATGMACGGSSHRLPAAVTLQGVGGIKLGMSAEQVDRLLHTQSVAYPQESSQWTYTLICAGKMQGLAEFFGPWYENPLVGNKNGLEWISFRAGAETDRGVGVGSTRAAVVRAYGKRLHQDTVQRATDTPSLYIIGPPTQMYPGVFVKPVLYFSFYTNPTVVSSLSYGARQQINRGGVGLEGPFC
jgi:hypothetical protein